MPFSISVLWLDLAGVTVFAISGALVASRKQLDIVGFALLATVTGIGGGTLRDLLLNQPVGALNAGVHPLVAIVMGVITATFGGIIRDVIGNELPLVLRKELYVTCAAAGATIFVLLQIAGMPLLFAQLCGFVTAFALRSIGIHFKLSLPAYKNRLGRDYPDDTH